MNRDEMLCQLSATLTKNSPKIIVARDGGPIRRIINGRQIKPTDLYPSFKGGMALPTEAEHEVGLLEISDVDKAVVCCLTQPHRVEIPVPWQSAPLIYFPDQRRDLADGTVEIIDTYSDDYPRLKDPHYALKLDIVQALYSRIGWKFRRIKASDIFAQPLYGNAHLMNTWAYARLSPGKIFSLETAIRQAGGALPLSSAAEIVGSEQLVYTLMVQRHVYCDLKKKVDEDTPIMMVDHAALRRCSTPIL
jgi:hypothetical protein